MTAGPRLELTWPGKDKFLLTPKDDEGKPVWVERSHPAASEVRLTELTGSHGDVGTGAPGGANLLFTGDSLDVLRVLAEAPEYRKHYRGKVKLCYIDPPFNTGQAFAHYDDWMEHSTWLSFMRDRLLLIRDLLATDGSVWVHLDEVEHHRMRLLMDEIFGASNFVTTVAWQKSDTLRNDKDGFSADFDNILVYRAGPDWRPNRMERPASMDVIYKSPDGDDRDWFNGGPTAPGARTHQGMVYGIQNPATGRVHYPLLNRCWALAQDDILTMVSEYARYELRILDDAKTRARVCGVPVDKVRPGVPAIVLSDSVEVAAVTALQRHADGKWPLFYFTGDGGKGAPGKKTYVPTGGIAPRTWWPHSEVGSNRTAKSEVKAVVPGVGTPFATPKPEALLARILEVSTNTSDLVLDCFAGSGTTAAVAHKLGRRWITGEISSATVGAYILPRLQRVLDGTDRGGVSTSTQRVAAEEVTLPDGMTPDDSQQFTTWLSRIVKSLDAPVDPATIRALRAANRTRDETTANWAGGGGFRTVDVCPSMYEVSPVGVMLADWATNGKFARAVAGQLGFEWEEDAAPFCGVRGRMRLAVFDGTVGVEEARHVVAALADQERVTIVAKAVLPGVEELVRDLSKGSRVRKAPRDLLEVGAARARRRMEGAAT